MTNALLFPFLLLVFGTQNVESYNFLIISPVFGFSHMKCMAAMANQLADAGHNVTYFQPFVVEMYQNHDLIKNQKIEVINYFHDELGRENIPDHGVLKDAWYSAKYQSDLGMRILVPRILHPTFEHMCRRMFEDHELHEMLKSKKFDVVLSETFDFCGLYFADFLEMPAIISLFTGSRLNALTNALGEPSFTHYFPAPSSHFGPDQTLYDRLNNLWHKEHNSAAFKELFNAQHAHLDKLTGGKVRHWTKILNDVTYHFSNSNPYLEFVIPTIPKVVPIGGYTMEYKKVPAVSEEMDKILGLRPHAVYISYGSMVLSKDMPDDYKLSMINLFKSHSNVTFLWKYEDPEEEFIRNSIPENVHLSKWFPQQSLLADKRVKLFITHGGLGSTMELAYAAKPAIVTPLFADQPTNAKILSRHGSVEVYSKHDIPNWKKQSDLLSKMLTDEKYQNAATRLAEILNHQPISPKELFLRHSENAARFGRMPSLTPFAKDMGFVEFYNLDIIAYSILFLLSAVYGAIETFAYILRRIRARKDEDGLEVTITKSIDESECDIKSAGGDLVDQYYRLADENDQEIGSNFGKKPYTFTLGRNQVIPGMDRAMRGMCIGEIRKVIIPPKLGFAQDTTGQPLYYTVQLVNLFRANPGERWVTEEGIQIEQTHKIEAEKCRKAERGDKIYQQYVLRLEDNTLVDSSYSRNAPFVFRLRNREVIDGMDIAMDGMCEGERRRVVIPSEYGYGAQGSPPEIPGGAKLFFEIVLEKLVKRDEL
uniref:peptidylprolyl isomerase n=2 Tax=Caenorhabditis japonica TaxID=281687 RepID=A0A8R1DWB9_CAEJA